MPFPRLSDVAVAPQTLVAIDREQRISAAARLYNDGELPPPADPPGNVNDLEAWNKVHRHA